jgi:hypothetical protein
MSPLALRDSAAQPRVAADAQEVQARATCKVNGSKDQVPEGAKVPETVGWWRQ